LLKDQRRALVLGDGDGRFLVKLLDENPYLRADAVDSSGAMLSLSRERAAHYGVDNRVCFYQTDARIFSSSAEYDLVVTHFFLDCLGQDEVADLIGQVSAALAPDARWLVSEFAIPERGPARYLGRALVRALYFVFRCLTGLRVQQLPDYGGIFRRAGFVCEHAQTSLFGILRSELWRAGNSRGPEWFPTAMPLNIALFSPTGGSPDVFPDPGPEPDFYPTPAPDPDPDPTPAPDPDPEPLSPFPTPLPVT
jgi:ubiquinone/menaquinone biosynthesis C-methylase UbiE